MTETNQTEPIGTGAVQDVAHVGIAVERVTPETVGDCPGCRVFWDELRYEMDKCETLSQAYIDLIKQHGKLAERYAASVERCREALDRIAVLESNQTG